MNRRTFLKKCALVAGSTMASQSCAAAGVQLANQTMQFRIGGKQPNIIFIMLDDSGIGDFECYYPATPVRSPNISKLAAHGMRFTNAYAAASLCAPSRSGLMTGYHLGHASVRGNFNTASIRAQDITIAEVLQKAGYATGGFGKWGLGAPGTAGAPERNGFDEFFGFYHQVHAHIHYPDRLYLNGQTYLIPENAGTSFRSDQLVPDQYVHQQNVIFDRMKQFIKTQAQNGKPFFAYGTWTLPHNDNTIPQAEAEPGGAYAPYRSENWTLRAKIQAAMITWVDRQIGQLLDLLADPNEDGNTNDSIADNTVFIFTSDNGGYEATVDGTWDRNAGLRGAKGSLYEGGLRVPLIFVWPNQIKPGTSSDLLNYFPDMMMTFADLAGATSAVPPDTDGISLVPTLTGRGSQQQRDAIYFQSHNIQPTGSRSEAVRMGQWKAIRGSGGSVSLYDLSQDPAESNNVASSYGSIVSQIEAIMNAEHTQMRPQFNVSPPKVGNISKDGIITYGVRPEPADRNWHLDESGDAKSLTGIIKENLGNSVSLYLDDLDRNYRIEMLVSVPGSAHPELHLEIQGNSGFVYFTGNLDTTSVSGGSSSTLSVLLNLTDVTPNESILSGDRNKSLTLQCSHTGSAGDVSISNITIQQV